MLSLPAACEVRPGETLRVIAPALLVIGESAIDATAAETNVPLANPRENERVSAFRLADVEALLEPLDRLDAFPNVSEVRPNSPSGVQLAPG